jgi:hypothetical protein
MFIEIIVLMNSTGDTESDVMDDDVIAVGMKPVQMFADSKDH